MTVGEMNVRRVLLFLLLMVCVIHAVSSFRNGWNGPNFIRKTRRINLNEYLVPPPLPKFQSGSRTARLAAPRPTEAPGYFTRLMGWLNPFNFGSSAQPYSPSSRQETPYPPSPIFIQSAPSSPASPTKISGSPLQVYERPPVPSASNNYQSYLPPAGGKNCNPCNKDPWIPMLHGQSPYSERDDAPLAPPVLPELPHLNNDYLPPPNNNKVPYDAHHAASQEVRTSDFSYTPTLFDVGQNRGPPLIPLPNPHLYPGAMPPLFKAKDFNHLIPTNSDKNLKHIGTSFPNGPLPPTVGSSYNNGQSTYPDISSHSDPGSIYHGLKYNNPDKDNKELEHFGVQNHEVHDDLSSSGSQISHGHTNFVTPGKLFENTATFQGTLNSLNQQGSFNKPSSAGVSNKEGFYVTTTSSLALDDFDTSSQVNQNPPSYGISNLGQTSSNFDNRYSDLSSSGSFAKNFHASSQTSDKQSSANIGNPIHFEESPLLDLTHKSESRTNSSSISPILNVFLDFEESAETAATITTPGIEIFKTLQDFVVTERSHFSTNPFQTITSVKSTEKLKINNNTTQDSNKIFHDSKKSLFKDVTYIPSSGQSELSWLSVSSTTSKSTERESSLTTLVNSYDDIEEATSNQNIYINTKDTNKTSDRLQGTKRSKQVQVIIPYTSQYTPLPFYPQYGRKQEGRIIYTSPSKHENLREEESRNKIKSTTSPDSSHKIQTLSTTPTTLIDNRRLTRMNNSIDIHRLQKNIDNWTIQEYSKGTTATTVSPSSANPYLFPSKQIPDEYLTTTEAIDHIDRSHENNVKRFTLAGFNFNDLEQESSASNRIEGPPIQVIRIKDSKSVESSIDTSISSTKDDTWPVFPVAISSVNKELVYVVTPQPVTTTHRSNIIEKKGKTVNEAEKNSKELRKLLETNTNKSNNFESIEKAYQVLPQAVNNLAVASTGPEKIPLWGIMEHEDFASSDNSEHDNEDDQHSEIPVLYAGHSKVSRGKR